MSPISWKDLRAKRALENCRARVQNAEGERMLVEADLEEEVEVPDVESHGLFGSTRACRNRALRPH